MILSYPKEDTKMRAQEVETRRGGNSGNTLEVLSHMNSVKTLQVDFIGSITSSQEYFFISN